VLAIVLEWRLFVVFDDLQGDSGGRRLCGRIVNETKFWLVESLKSKQAVRL
jgi:hypothetical protein